MTLMTLYNFVQAWATHAGSTGRWMKSMGHDGHEAVGLGCNVWHVPRSSFGRCGLLCGATMPGGIHVAITRQPHDLYGAVQPGTSVGNPRGQHLWTDEIKRS